MIQQSVYMRPATHLWRLFTLVDLIENMQQQRDTTFVDILNVLRAENMKTEQLAVLLAKISTNVTGEFAIDKPLRIYPTND